MHCAEHDLWFEEDDTCPVCEGIEIGKEMFAKNWPGTYQFALNLGIKLERKRILDWVNKNRSEYRDHFTSDHLIKFIEEGNNE